MKITKTQLKQIIKEELGRVMEQEEYLPLYKVFGKALNDFVEETELRNNPEVVEAVKDYDWETDYEDWDKRNVLVLGTIKHAGGDFLYDAIKEAGLLDSLLDKLVSYSEQYAKPVKRPRKIGIIPYTEYKWNEDKWGEEL